jgi:N-acetylglucosaminyldiphosphoundecaprenol N-acetyl-beta-D-mannosaminyltransferase
MMMRSLRVLGTPLLVTDYDALGAACMRWAREGRTIALDFANTQVATMRRHDNAFRDLTSTYDHFPPDGMPLIWCMNAAGARLKDRVYGPIFMERFLSRAPGEFTHFLVGGSEECGERLKARFQKINPALRFVGSFHGRCAPDGRLNPEDEGIVLEQLEQLKPDFIWVGFGTPKQQTWVKHYKNRISQGVILTVGFAFDVNAGMKPDAPMWMQRYGLTWIFRLCSEPRRLVPRYFKYNLLFLSYLLLDGLRGRAWERQKA